MIPDPAPEPPLAAVTIDVDSLRFYRQIHGLAAPAGAAAQTLATDPIYTIALPRFWALVEEARIPPTLFLIGADAPAHPAAFAPARALGAEIANHSFAHDYRLTAATPEAIADDLARAHAALAPLAPGGEVCGFRAPGYNTSAPLLEGVRALGYRYDSSLLPSPAYFAARAAAIRLYAALGRPSRSLAGDVRAFAGPQTPYWAEPARPWRRAEDGILELPMACDPLTRLPLFGTSWVLAPARLRDGALRRALARLPLLNFEMHAIDLLDASDPGVGTDLAAAQRDLRVPARTKIEAFRTLFRTLADRARVSTLGGAAAALAAGWRAGANPVD